MKLFYLFIKRNPWNFEWELMREWVGWVETPPTRWGERWGHHIFVAAFPSYKKRGESTLSSHTCCHPSLPPPATPPLGHSLGEAMTILFLHHTTPSCCWSSGGSSTSAAPLDRGNRGHHQAIRVAQYGGTARCSVHLHDLDIGKWSTTPSTRIILETLSVFEGEFSWNLVLPVAHIH